VAVGNKVGSEGWKALGVTIIGGLSFSTLITLVLVPTVYYMFERRKEARVLKTALLNPTGK
jgi:multidrug efflux pump subunit AcrB